jgi:hypothetical protein
VVNSQGRIEKRIVRLGIETPSRLEVISGLSGGEQVVAANLSSFRVGEVVRPQNVTLSETDENFGKAEE